MANYVSEAELNTILGTSGETALLTELNELATAYINNFLRITTLAKKTAQEEIQDYNGTNEYFTKELNPSDLVEVNGATVVGVVDITWRKITFQHTPINTDTIFNKITLKYTYGYETIPDDIKWVVYWIVGYLYNWRKTAGIKSFTQWQITVTKDDVKSIESMLIAWLTKYRKNTIYC